MAVAGDANHAVVEILDPAVDRFAVSKLYLDTDVTVAEGAQVERLLPGVARRRSS